MIIMEIDHDMIIILIHFNMWVYDIPSWIIMVIKNDVLNVDILIHDAWLMIGTILCTAISSDMMDPERGDLLTEDGLHVFCDAGLVQVEKSQRTRLML